MTRVHRLTPPRPLIILGTALGVAFLVVTALVLLAHATGPRIAGEARLAAIHAPVEIGLDRDGVIHLRATSSLDLFAGLGYAHALRHPWSMTLWNITATGNRSRWSADSVAVLQDQHLASLGIPRRAQEAYLELPDSLRVLFDAYVEGVNTSFARNRLERADEFIVVALRHEPWEPWHPIAIEMLMAYLMAAVDLQPPPELRHLEPPAAVRRFLAADSLLRRTLLLDGFQHSLAMGASNAGQMAFLHRLVFGQSAVPLVQMASVQFRGEGLALATLPGTLALLGGISDGRAWGFVPAPAATLTAEPLRPPERTFDRVVRHDGSEILVTTRRARGVLFLQEDRVVLRPDLLLDPAPGPAAPVAGPTPQPPQQPAPAPAAPAVEPAPEDAVEPPAPQRVWWTLQWRGIGGTTDILAWLALLTEEQPRLELFDGGGLVSGPALETSVFGHPGATASVPGGILIGGTDDVRAIAEVLAQPDTLFAAPERLGATTLSAWATRLGEPLIRALGHPDEVEMRLRDPVAFLQGWTFEYEGDAIAASIFERWMLAYRRAIGRIPDPALMDLRPVERVDTVFVRFADLVAQQVAQARAEGRRRPPLADTLAARPELADSLVATTRTLVEHPPDLRHVKRALGDAIAELTALHGRPGPAWQWYRVNEAFLRLPGRTDAPGEAPRARRYRDVPLGDGGHPTALRWGPSPLFDQSAHPASFSMWSSSADWRRAFFLLREPFTEPLHARYADPPEPTPVRSVLRGAPAEVTVRLLPAP